MKISLNYSHYPFKAYINSHDLRPLSHITQTIRDILSVIMDLHCWIVHFHHGNQVQQSPQWSLREPRWPWKIVFNFIVFKNKIHSALGQIKNSISVNCFLNSFNRSWKIYWRKISCQIVSNGGGGENRKIRWTMKFYTTRDKYFPGHELRPNKKQQNLITKGKSSNKINKIVIFIEPISRIFMWNKVKWYTFYDWTWTKLYILFKKKLTGHYN